MNRYLIMLAGLFATLSASADTGSYFRVVLFGDGQAHEYRLDPSTLSLSLASRCPDGVRSTCAFMTDPTYQAESAEHDNMEKALLSSFGKQRISSRAAADSLARRAVTADHALGYAQYKFEVRNLESGAIESSATTKRHISAAEMLGNRGCVLLLTSTYRLGRMPWDWLISLAGHPPEYETFYLEVYGADGKVLNELLVKKDLKYGGGYLLPHREDERDTPIGPNGPC